MWKSFKTGFGLAMGFTMGYTIGASLINTLSERLLNAVEALDGVVKDEDEDADNEE